MLVATFAGNLPQCLKQQATEGDPGLQLVSLKKYNSGQQANVFTFGQESDREGWQQVMVGQPKGLALQILLEFLEGLVRAEAG